MGGCEWLQQWKKSLLSSSASFSVGLWDHFAENRKISEISHRSPKCCGATCFVRKSRRACTAINRKYEASARPASGLSSVLRSDATKLQRPQRGRGRGQEEHRRHRQECRPKKIKRKGGERRQEPSREQNQQLTSSRRRFTHQPGVPLPHAVSSLPPPHAPHPSPKVQEFN